ncbi:MAG: hypothetical protein TU35_007200 [Thermoproteus sp. AZ2]|uniref:Uncharacterized protein n=1 Tax=Thermoproteus sp. AZ2 TaxID=1609232 RepID=A0ACC6V2T5_9CREN
MRVDDLIRLAYLFGVLAFALALYLILHPYSVHVYYSGPLKPLNISVSGTVVLQLNNTSPSPAEVPVAVKGSVLGAPFNATVTISIPPRSLASYNYTYIDYIEINSSNSNIYLSIIGLKITLLNVVLTIIMLIFFILMVAFLVVGFLYRTTYTYKRPQKSKNENLKSTLLPFL